MIIRKKIKGYSDYEIDKNGNVFRLHKQGTEKKLKPTRDSGKYLMVALYKNSHRKYHKIHRLLAQAFISNPKSLRCVCHKNDKRDDNRLYNLYWGSDSDNMKDKFRNGYSVLGENSPASKLTDGKVFLIKNLYKTGHYSHRRLAKIFGVCKSSIAYVLTYGWKHITI